MGRDFTFHHVMIKKMGFIKNKPLWLIGVSVIGLLLLILIGYQAALLLLSIVLTYLIIEDKLSNSIFSSKIYKLVIAVVLYVAILQSVAMAAWLFDHDYPLNSSIWVSFLVLILVYVWEWRLGAEKIKTLSSKSIRLFTLPDVIAICIGLFVLVLIVAAPTIKSFKDYGTINVPATAVAFMNTNLDDASHLSRINDRLQLNRGVLYDSNQAKNVVLQDTISTYPSGWYVANAMIIKSFDPSIKVGGQSLVAYVLTKIFWTFVLAFLFARVIYDLFLFFLRKGGRKHLWLSNFWLVGAASFFSYYIVVEQFKEGFYTFIPVLISLLIAIPLFIQLTIDKESAHNRKFRVLLPIVLIIACLTLSWVLIFPAVAAAALIAFFVPATKDGIRKNLIALVSEIKNLLPAFVVIVLGILVQLIIITAPSSQSFKTGVDTPGSIAVPSLAFFGFVVIGVVLFYLLVKGKLKKAISDLTLLMTFLLAFSLVIYLFQFATIHGSQYYFYKTLDTALIIAIPISIVGWLGLLDLINTGLDLAATVMFICGLLVCLPLIVGVQSPNDPGLLKYVGGRRSISFSENQYFYDSLSYRAKVPLAKRDATVIFDIPGDVGDSIIGSNILRSIQPVNSCDNAIFNNLLINNQSGLFSAIKTCAPEPLKIATISVDYKAIDGLVNTYGIANKVSVVQLN